LTNEHKRQALRFLKSLGTVSTDMFSSFASTFSAQPTF